MSYYDIVILICGTVHVHSNVPSDVTNNDGILIEKTAETLSHKEPFKDNKRAINTEISTESIVRKSRRMN